MTTTVAEFKTILPLYTPVSISEEEIDDRQRGKTLRSKFSSVMLEAGVLSDEEKIMVMTSVVPSGNRLPAKSRAALAVEQVTATTESQEAHKEVGAVS